MRAVELVGGAREEVGAERGDVDERVRGVVDGVDEHERAGGVGELGRAAHVVDRPERVRRGADREELRPRSERRGEVLHVELAGLGVEAHGPDLEAALARDAAPGIDVGVVVELGDHDLVARGPALAQRAPEVERERRHVGAERDLGGPAAQEVGERLARGRERGVGLDARRVRPVRVGVVVEQVVADGLHDGSRHLRPAGPVEVGDGRVVVTPLEGGEAGADLVEARGWARRHRIPRRISRPWAEPGSPNVR